MQLTTPTPFSPSDYPRVRMVQSFEELVATPFADGVNALCWPRLLPGDFGEVVEQLGAGEGILTLEDERLQNLAVSAGGRMAIEQMVADQERLRNLERE